MAELTGGTPTAALHRPLARKLRSVGDLSRAVYEEYYETSRVRALHVPRESAPPSCRRRVGHSNRQRSSVERAVVFRSSLMIFSSGSALGMERARDNLARCLHTKSATRGRILCGCMTTVRRVLGVAYPLKDWAFIWFTNQKQNNSGNGGSFLAVI